MGAIVDIHAHILPGIDDGPDDLEQSLEMARAAVESGISTIASTPHLRPDFPDVHIEQLADCCESLRDELNSAGIPLTVVSSAEASLTWAITAGEQELRLASYGQRGTDLLIETPTVNAVAVDQLLYGVRAKGYRVTLAHPERSLDFQEDGTQLRALVDQGVLLQVNADSLLGTGPVRGAKRLARDLLTTGLAHAIASDAHRGTQWRPITRLQDAVHAASDLVGLERVEWMTQAAPRAILGGANLPEAPPVAAARPRRRRFGFARR